MQTWAFGVGVTCLDISSGKVWNDGASWADDHTAETRRRRVVRNTHNAIVQPYHTGTGIGSNATVSYITPGLANGLRQGAVPVRFEKPDPEKIANPDEVLVHELVHAMRTEVGVADYRAVPRQKGYHYFEEFFAMVVTNIYRSEDGRKGVRNDNHGAMIRSEITDKEFIETEGNRRHLRQFRRDHRQLFSQLKAIDDIPWNPLRHMTLN